MRRQLIRPRRRAINNSVGRIFFFSTDDADVQIPAPTWSIASLQLDQNHEPASQSEFETLCKRALIDPSTVPSPPKLRQDLGNMLHMIQQIVDDTTITVNHQHTATNSIDLEDPAVLYDVPRGVTEAPLRRDDAVQTNNNNMQSSSCFVWQPKLKRSGAHQYFEIVTARGRGSENDNQNE